MDTNSIRDLFKSAECCRETIEVESRHFNYLNNENVKIKFEVWNGGSIRFDDEFYVNTTNIFEREKIEIVARNLSKIYEERVSIAKAELIGIMNEIQKIIKEDKK